MSGATFLALLVILATVLLSNMEVAKCDPQYGQNYTLPGGECISVHTEALSQREASSACQKRNGTLLKILTSAKQANIDSVMADRFPDSASLLLWIEYPKNDNSKWTWGSADNLTEAYTNWKQGEPAYCWVFWGCSECATLSYSGSGGTWQPTACDSTHGYICDIDCPQAELSTVEPTTYTLPRTNHSSINSRTPTEPFASTATGKPITTTRNAPVNSVREDIVPTRTDAKPTYAKSTAAQLDNYQRTTQDARGSSARISPRGGFTSPSNSTVPRQTHVKTTPNTPLVEQAGVGGATTVAQREMPSLDTIQAKTPGQETAKAPRGQDGGAVHELHVTSAHSNRSRDWSTTDGSESWVTEEWTEEALVNSSLSAQNSSDANNGTSANATLVSDLVVTAHDKGSDGGLAIGAKRLIVTVSAITASGILVALAWWLIRVKGRQGEAEAASYRNPAFELELSTPDTRASSSVPQTFLL